MLRKTIKYVNFNGEETTETMYFNMSTPDMTKFIAKYSDYSGIDINDEDGAQKALQQYADKLVASKNMPKIFEFIEDLILSAYGVKSDDGKRFMKSVKIREEFSWTEAYASFFEELMSDENKYKQFIEGITDKSPKSSVKAGISVVQ